MKTNSLSAWILAVRPYSLGASIMPVIVGTAFALSEGSFKVIPALLCLIFAVLMQCTANLVNDLWDSLKGADQPDRLGPDRAFAKGFITQEAMKKGIFTLTAIACAAGLGLIWYGGFDLIWVGILCVAFAYFYTAGPWPLAYHGMGDIAVILFFGLIPVLLTYYLQTGTFSSPVLAASLACGLVTDTMLMVNNFRDREEDARAGKRTIVVAWGANVGRWGYFALGTLAMLLCITILGTERVWTALVPLLYYPFFLFTWRKMVLIDHGEGLNVCLAETSRNILIFGGLLTIGILLG